MTYNVSSGMLKLNPTKPMSLHLMLTLVLVNLIFFLLIFLHLYDILNCISLICQCVFCRVLAILMLEILWILFT